MARPAKSVKVKSGAIANGEENLRNDIEDKLRGKHILGKLDVYVLECTAIAISRIRQINEMVNQDPSLLSDTALQGTRDKYQKDMWRGANELCLSPQARAKIGSLAAQAAKAKTDPLAEALRDDD